MALGTNNENENHETVVNNYINYWAGKDPMTENEVDKEARKSNYTYLTNSYYNILTDFT
ncbi:2781_t:CDS:2, partial [Entrophospora sp. SA101]